jgi:hypothetical protein
VNVPLPDPTLRDELLRRFEAGVEAPITDAEFEILALRVFRFQFEHNPLYRAYCVTRGVTPDAAGTAQEIPAVPTSAFKAVPLVVGDPDSVEAVFRTSGTTRGAERRGTHRIPDLSLYRAALAAGFRAHLLPDVERIPILFLVPQAVDVPDSSLSFMASEVAHRFGTRVAWFADAERLDLEALLAALRASAEAEQPICLFTTSLALARLLEALARTGEHLSLPEGSRVMDTGGFKGQRMAVDRSDLYEEVQRRLGVATRWCVNEYGMTELSSQFYDTVAGNADGAEVGSRRYRSPPWVRTVAVDPETLAPLTDGEIGILRHHDLANLGSVAVIQTEDLGVCGPGGFRLLGRAAGAEPRGCSLAAEALVSAARGGSR